jgi:hypothetical protein
MRFTCVEGPWCWLRFLVGQGCPGAMARGWIFSWMLLHASLHPSWVVLRSQGHGSSPACIKMGTLLQSVDSLPGRKICSASCSLWAGGGVEEGLLDRQGVVIFRPWLIRNLDFLSCKNLPTLPFPSPRGNCRSLEFWSYFMFFFDGLKWIRSWKTSYMGNTICALCITS